jgi:hypothetical protein
MSFFRQVKIYRSDRLRWELDTKYNSRPDHHFDESSTGYSSTGGAPAEPAAASPVTHSFSLSDAAVQQAAANADLSLFPLSQQKGALQFVVRDLNAKVATTGDGVRVRLGFPIGLLVED